jgi:hypothetical protein
MFAAIFSFSLIPVAIAIGVGLPWAWLHWELKYQDKLLHVSLAAQASIIEDQEATIDAYREVVSVTMDDLEAIPQNA